MEWYLQFRAGASGIVTRCSVKCKLMFILKDVHMSALPKCMVTRKEIFVLF